MPEILFVSDTHLDQHHPERIDLFTGFLTERATSASTIYLLGDLFEYWIGDDSPVEPALAPVLRAFEKLHELGKAVFFVAGNRDFLLGKRFMSRFGWTLLPEESVLELYDERILLMHGDTLCTDDVAYQRYRRLIQSSVSIRLLNRLPLKTRQRLARRLRKKSVSATRNKHYEIMDVNPLTVTEKMQQHAATVLIHGHTHRPDIHHIQHQQLKYTRIVLGDWHNKGSFLCWDDRGFRLETYAGS